MTKQCRSAHLHNYAASCFRTAAGLDAYFLCVTPLKLCPFLLPFGATVSRRLSDKNLLSAPRCSVAFLNYK